MTPALTLALIVAALLLSGLFSALHQSLRELSRARLLELVESRGRAGLERSVGSILDDLDAHAEAMAVPRIVLNLFIVVLTVVWLADVRQVDAPGWGERIGGVFLAAVLIWVVGFVAPGSVARHAPERAVCAWAGLVRATYWLMTPLRGVTVGLDEVVRRLAGAREVDQAEAITEELMEVVEEHEREGQLDERDRVMIESVVRFREKTVEQVMTPRIDVEALELTNDLGAVTKLIRTVGHSRIPVYEGSLDHVVGIFYVKDLIRWLAGGRADGRPFELRRILRPALFVPETKTVRELLAELLAKKVHIAMVADEYGGTAGLVTMEDIVEEVFGDIQDEYEQPETEIGAARVDGASRSAEVDARMRIDDLNDALEPLGIELPESEDYDTAAGFVVTTLGRIPVPGEVLEHARARVTVLGAEPTRVLRLKVEVIEPPGGASGEEPADAAEPEASPPSVRSARRPPMEAREARGAGLEK